MFSIKDLVLVDFELFAANEIRLFCAQSLTSDGSIWDWRYKTIALYSASVSGIFTIAGMLRIEKNTITGRKGELIIGKKTKIGKKR